jgi:hypothetical protein
MRVALALLIAVLTFAIAGSSAGSPLQTEIVHWSPFDTSGQIKSSLDVQQLGKGECIGRSLTIGDAGYRCKAGRWVLDPCWRSGDGVACVGFPWDTVVSTIRVPADTFSVGAISQALVNQSLPWAVELADGPRCRVLQSSHSTVTLRGRPLAVAYDCDDGLVLLRNLSRGRVWRVATAKWDHGRYAVDPGVIVRRAFFG